MSDQWLHWVQRLQSLAQAGLAYSKDVFDQERYEEIRAIAAEIMAKHTDLEMTRILDIFGQDTGYQTPKSDVRGVVFRENKILLVQETHDDRWSLPGGFCDVGLSPSENVVKEIQEESGYETVPVKLLALLDKNKHPHPQQAFHYYKIFIRCEIVGGEPETGIETRGVRFFAEDELPMLSTERVTESQIRLLFQDLIDPGRPTVLD